MKKLLIYIIIGFIIPYGCVKEKIEINELTKLNYNGDISDVIIEGYISSEKSVQFVKLSKPSKLVDSNKYTPINNAEVFVTDGETTYRYGLSTTEGLYQSNAPFQGVIGKVYTINVLFENMQYTASDSMIFCDSIINYPINQIRIFDSHIEIHSNEHNFGFDKPCIWTFIEKQLDSLNRFPHIDINFSERFFFIYNHTGNLPQGIFPSGFTSIGLAGPENDTLEIVKMAVSDAYYNYLVSYFNITDWNSGMFSTIPGNTLTNVSKGGTGYFHTTDIKRFRMTYKDLKSIYH